MVAWKSPLHRLCVAHTYSPLIMPWAPVCVRLSSLFWQINVFFHITYTSMKSFTVGARAGERKRERWSKQAQAWNKNYEWSLKMILFLFNLTLEQIFRIQVGLGCDYNHSHWNSEREMTSDIPYTINICMCTYGVRHKIAVHVCVCACVLGNPYEWPKRKREETIKATITTATKESNTPYRSAHTQSHIHTYATVLSCTANVLWTFTLITYRIDTHDTNRHVAQEEEHTYPVC